MAGGHVLIIGEIMGVSELNTWIRSCWEVIIGYVTWDHIKAFGNSNFLMVLVGSLAGAFAGAYAAQRIVERSKARDDLLKEIRNTNVAITLSCGVCNSLLKMKKQNIKSLKEDFESSRKKLIEIKRKSQTGEIHGSMPFNFKADLQLMPIPQLPTETLQKQVFEKLSVGNRPLSAVISLIESTVWLSESIEKRNQLIEQYKAESADKDPEFYKYYFGFPYADGHVNLMYPNTIDAIYLYTNDAIFFSHLLCDDLNKHGKVLSAGFKKKFGRGAPLVNEVDFEKPRTTGLLPNNEDYLDWLNGFVKKE